MRGLAVSQGLADPWLEDLLENDQPLPVVLAAVGRCSDNRLPALLQDDRWQVRAEVLALLSQREAKFVEEIRTLSRSELLSTRTAAVKLLLAWGDDEWLRENLLSES